MSRRPHEAQGGSFIAVDNSLNGIADCSYSSDGSVIGLRAKHGIDLDSSSTGASETLDVVNVVATMNKLQSLKGSGRTRAPRTPIDQTRIAESLPNSA
jgi:hypothetical protein